MGAVLRTVGLTTTLYSRSGVVPLVEDVNLRIDGGERVALVGESGSGKTLTALAIVRLLADWRLRASGTVEFDGVDLMSLSETKMQRIRGNRIGLVPQDPMTSLNPTLTVGRQLMEVLKVHKGLSGRAARREAVSLLDQVEIANAAQRLNDYPHQFSGGMRQRVLIAIAVSCDPMLVIADEATSALDATTQSQIMALLGELCRTRGSALLFVTHNLALVASECDRVYVMYAGRVVESGPVPGIYDKQWSPYTKLLLSSIPDPGMPRKSRLRTIDGSVLTPAERAGVGCRFSNRCPYVRDECRDAEPELTPRPGAAREARCWGFEDVP